MTTAPPFMISYDDTDPAALRLRIAGEIDIATAAALAAALRALPSGHAVIVLDLSGVTFADVAGYRALASACEDLASRGELKMTGGTPAVVLKIGGLGGFPASKWLRD